MFCMKEAWIQVPVPHGPQAPAFLAPHLDLCCSSCFVSGIVLCQPGFIETPLQPGGCALHRLHGAFFISHPFILQQDQFSVIGLLTLDVTIDKQK